MKILAWRLPELKEKIEKFNKKATKWNLPLVTFEVLGTEVEERAVAVDEEGRPVMANVEVCHLEIQGETPRLAGWAIHSKVQPSDIAGQNYVFTTANHSPLESLRTCPLFCDHCQSKRLKKTGYWIENEDGRQMMVGATCLKDFLPAVDVASLIDYMNKLGELSNSDFEDGQVPRAYWVYKTEEAVMDAYVSIKQYGFLSKAKADEQCTLPTSDDIDASPKRKAELYKGQDVEALREELKDFIPHMLAKSAAGNDFIHNVQLALQSEITRPKLYGYIAAAVWIWMKDMADAREASASSNEWVGKVGERLTLNDLTITRLSMSEGQYGWTYIYGFADKAGNQFTWFGSKHIGDINAVVSLKGTVKKHDEFKGRKQTVLTRCSVN